MESFKILLNVKDLSFKLNSLQSEIVEIRIKFAELGFQVGELNKKYDELKKVVDAIHQKQSPADNKEPFPVSGKKIIYHNNLLWLKDDDSPYCPRCYDVDKRLVHMQRIMRYYASKRETAGFESFSCPQCSLLNPIVEPPA